MRAWSHDHLRQDLGDQCDGNIGRHLVPLLAEAGVAVTRDPGRTGLPGGVEVVRGDLTEPETLEAALESVGAVFLLWPFFSAAGAQAVVEAIARHAHRGRLRLRLLRAGRARHGAERGVGRDRGAAAGGISGGRRGADARVTGDEHLAGSARGLGATEAERRHLTEADLRSIVENELRERSVAAEEHERIGRDDHAERLRAEAEVLSRHLGPAL
ncbi:NAD(P)H-binding protein [Nonomuraea roseola]|uniref:NAD(P)H-binding protein n=1 Tax=Nonomuraea roseola TaxID=46179 RepID=A0ABV5Q3W8_9ACTN